MGIEGQLSVAFSKAMLNLKNSLPEDQRKDEFVAKVAAYGRRELSQIIAEKGFMDNKESLQGRADIQ